MFANTRLIFYTGVLGQCYTNNIVIRESLNIFHGEEICRINEALGSLLKLSLLEAFRKEASKRFILSIIYEIDIASVSIWAKGEVQRLASSPHSLPFSHHSHSRSDHRLCPATEAIPISETMESRSGH